MRDYAREAEDALRSSEYGIHAGPLSPAGTAMLAKILGPQPVPKFDPFPIFTVHVSADFNAVVFVRTDGGIEYVVPLGEIYRWRPFNAPATTQSRVIDIDDLEEAVATLTAPKPKVQS